MKALTLRDTEAKCGLKKSEIYKRIAAKDFPAPLKIGRASRWLDHELDAYLTALADQRKAAK